MFKIVKFGIKGIKSVYLSVNLIFVSDYLRYFSF